MPEPTAPAANFWQPGFWAAGFWAELFWGEEDTTPPPPQADEFRPPVLGRGPGTTITAGEMRRQIHQQRRRARRQREDMLFL